MLGTPARAGAAARGDLADYTDMIYASTAQDIRPAAPFLHQDGSSVRPLRGALAIVRKFSPPRELFGDPVSQRGWISLQ
jgi:hypothetical protein